MHDTFKKLKKFQYGHAESTNMEIRNTSLGEACELLMKATLRSWNWDQGGSCLELTRTVEKLYCYRVDK